MLCKKKTISLFCVSTCLGVLEAVCCSSLAIMCVSPLSLLPVALYVRFLAARDAETRRTWKQQQANANAVAEAALQAQQEEM